MPNKIVPHVPFVYAYCLELDIKIHFLIAKPALW